jgi:hypothetical protein
MTPEELMEIEKEFYSEEKYDNYELAEWARIIVPKLIKEIRKLMVDK